MKIAVIADQQSTHAISRVAAMAARGHQVRWVTTFNEIEDSDIVHIHYASNRLAWSMLMHGNLPPIVVTVMGGDVLDDEQYPLPAIARGLVRMLLGAASLVTVKTPYLHRVVASKGVTEHRIADIPWGVDSTIFHSRPAVEFRNKYGIPADVPVIISPRSLRPFYNHALIIEALAALVIKAPQARLLLTRHGADAGYEKKLCQIAEGYGCSDNIIWVDELSPQEMADAYNAADLAVSLAPSDGFPQSVWEAMACGTACLVPDLPHFRGVVSPGRDIAVTSLDATSLAKVLGELLLVDAKRQAIAEAGKLTVMKLGSLSDNAAQLEKAMMTVLQSPAAPLSWGSRLWVRIVFLLWGLRDSIRASQSPDGRSN